MKRLDCPVIGLRPVSEFDYLGDVRPLPMQASDEVWAAHVFNRNGAPGIKRERWYHRPTGYWFIFDRDTLTDTIVAIVDPAEVRHDHSA